MLVYRISGLWFLVQPPSRFSYFFVLAKEKRFTAGRYDGGYAPEYISLAEEKIRSSAGCAEPKMVCAILLRCVGGRPMAGALRGEVSAKEAMRCWWFGPQNGRCMMAMMLQLPGAKRIGAFICCRNVR